MKKILDFGRISEMSFWRVVLCAVITSLLASTVSAQPIKYTGFTITDGQLGSWYFHNARVILTFVSDTKNVQSNVQFQLPPSPVTANLNIQGRAAITIVGDDKTVHATFSDPNQKIFISYDQNNDGIGFGVCSPDCLGLLSVPQVFPSVFQPVYPFGISQFDDSGDLTHDIGGTGRSFSCIDFGMPDSAYTSLCPPPNLALKTDKGDLYLFQRYQEENDAGEFKSSNAGFFFADTSWSESTLPYTVFASSTQTPTRSMTYNLFFVSDVTIGQQSFINAKINLSFRSHTSKGQPLAGVGPNAYVNDSGTARIVITKGSQTISAEFAPGQLYVFFNPNTATAGFGSYAPDGSRQLAYPIILGPLFGSSPQLLEDVSDIITNPNDAGLYSPETQAVAQVTDLKHATLLADYVSSCTAFTFNPARGIICSPQAPPAGLMTDKGLLYIPESAFGWGAFWSSFNPPNDDD
jgi:hypothetical protein